MYMDIDGSQKARWGFTSDRVFNINDPASYPDRLGGDRPYDRNALFNTQNHDKKSISLDLKSPAGQDTLRFATTVCTFTAWPGTTIGSLPTVSTRTDEATTSASWN